MPRRHPNGTRGSALNAISKVPSADTWAPLAAGAVFFMIPVVVFGLLMRKHLLRGVTFGAVKG